MLAYCTPGIIAVTAALWRLSGAAVSLGWVRRGGGAASAASVARYVGGGGEKRKSESQTFRDSSKWRMTGEKGWKINARSVNDAASRKRLQSPYISVLTCVYVHVRGRAYRDWWLRRSRGGRSIGCWAVATKHKRCTVGKLQQTWAGEIMFGS